VTQATTDEVRVIYWRHRCDVPLAHTRRGGSAQANWWWKRPSPCVRPSTSTATASSVAYPSHRSG